MKKKNMILQVCLIAIFTILCALIIFPFILLVSASLSSAADLSTKGYQIIPNPVDFSAYQFILQSPYTIIRAYLVTFIFSIVSMVFAVAFMSMIAYPLARTKLKGKGFINFFLYFTMLFGGGLVPTYLLLAGTLHLDNTIWIYILPALINPWHVFMIRTFFKGIPEEIIESATIDGASEYTIFVRMILPLSKPVLATIALFTFLGKWNDWNTALIYITNDKLYSLQYLLQSMMKELEIIQQMEQQGMSTAGIGELSAKTVRMAMAVVVAGPALLVFPFFQKYFVKGLTVGSVKG